MEIKVRFSETDALGHINNANYFTYMEEARISFLKELEIDIENAHFVFILASTSCDFISQGYYGDTLNVETHIIRIGNKSVTLGSHLFEKESERLIARGQATIVYFDVDKQISVEVDDSFKEKLKVHLR